MSNPKRRYFGIKHQNDVILVNFLHIIYIKYIKGMRIITVSACSKQLSAYANNDFYYPYVAACANNGYSS